MKKLLCVLSLAFAATTAQADIISGNLTLAGDGTTPLVGTFNPTPGIGAAPTTVYTGSLKATATGLFTATFLGSESGWKDFYLDGTNVMFEVAQGGSIGSSATINVNKGDVVNFGFNRVKNGVPQTPFMNGKANTDFEGIGFFKNQWGLKDANGRLFDWLIGYNDAAPSDADYDDFIVGVVQTPVPAALPLMASALGLFGFSRRKTV